MDPHDATWFSDVLKNFQGAILRNGKACSSDPSDPSCVVNPQIVEKKAMNFFTVHNFAIFCLHCLKDCLYLLCIQLQLGVNMTNISSV